MTKNTQSDSTPNRLVRACRMHFYFVLLLAIQIMLYDAWKLITPEAVLQRWLVAAGLLIATTVVWYLAKNPGNDSGRTKRLVFSLVAVDIVAVSTIIYMTRGMASRAVLLYIIPIVTAAALQSRTALFASAFFSIAAYTSTAVAYFVLNFNEGYKIELYGEVGFYSAGLLLLAGLLWAVIKVPRNG